MNTIAIDCGASFLKGALIDEKGNILNVCNRQTPSVKPATLNESITHINKIVQGVKEILQTLAPDGEAKLCISNEMHGFLLADANGLPLCDYISWQHEYANMPHDEGTWLSYMEKDSAPKEKIRLTGMPLKAGLPSTNLFVLLRERGFAEERLFFYTLGDYILRVLSGQEPQIHITNAAATGLYNILQGSWLPELLGGEMAERIVFPKTDDGDMLSFSFGKTKLTAPPAIGDQQAALLGASFSEENAVSINLGTGSQVSMLSRQPDFSGRYQTRPYFNGMWLRTIPHIPCGRALNVYFRFIKECAGIGCDSISDETVWEYILGQAEDCAKGTLSVDMSFFANALTDRERGSIAEIPEYGFTVGQLFRSIYDKMADSYYETANIIAGEKIGKVDKIIFSGGIAKRHALLRETISRRFKGAEAILVEDETFKGLYLYGAECSERIGKAIT